MNFQFFNFKIKTLIANCLSVRSQAKAGKLSARGGSAFGGEIGNSPRGRSGLTVIELVLVLGLIAIASGALLLAINPAAQLIKSRNTERWSEVNLIMNAITEAAARNHGTLVCSAGEVPSATTTIKSGLGGYDLAECLVPSYLQSLPIDPSSGGSYVSTTSYNTGYAILKNASTSRITVTAPFAEGGEVVGVTR